MVTQTTIVREIKKYFSEKAQRYLYYILYSLVRGVQMWVMYDLGNVKNSRFFVLGGKAKLVSLAANQCLELGERRLCTFLLQFVNK